MGTQRAQRPGSMGVGSRLGGLYMARLFAWGAVGCRFTHAFVDGGRRRIAGTVLVFQAKDVQKKMRLGSSSLYLQLFPATRTLIPASANNVDSDGAVARVGFILLRENDAVIFQQ
jgi:hypothetical protein